MNDIITALCARDFKGASVQWFDENKFVLRKNDSSIGSKTTQAYHSAQRADRMGGVRNIDY